ncbi:hypothetical protein ONZ45_g12543 [Pleurotus djamor]|nr:hypothetical protein ONZ45_g12543 [Pleurotus djamor]
MGIVRCGITLREYDFRAMWIPAVEEDLEGISLGGCEERAERTRLNARPPLLRIYANPLLAFDREPGLVELGGKEEDEGNEEEEEEGGGEEEAGNSDDPIQYGGGGGGREGLDEDVLNHFSAEYKQNARHRRWNDVFRLSLSSTFKLVSSHKRTHFNAISSGLGMCGVERDVAVPVVVGRSLEEKIEG